MYRSNLTFISRVIFTSFWMFLGKANFQQSQKFIDDGGTYNTELIDTMFPSIKWAMIILTFGRLICIFISIKKLAICKIYIYYQAIYILLEEFLPRDYGDMQHKLLMANNIMNFGLLYFSFWPGAIFMLATQVF